MAVRIQNLNKKSFGQAHFTLWNSNEQSPQSLSKNLSFEVASPPQLYHEEKHIDLQLWNQGSVSSQSIGQSCNEFSEGGQTSSQDQCISSASDESCGKSTEGRMKPVFLFSTPEIAFNPLQADNSHSMAHEPFPYAGHYFSGLFTSYVSQNTMGSQIVGMTTGRVPLPLDLADDGPIYVNAKQYHGILRRRQSCAKLEAQNKLVKSRKPYLHESRHLHALNRVRGSGGRFLSKKKVQQDLGVASKKHDVSDSIHSTHRSETSEFGTRTTTCPKW